MPPAAIHALLHGRRVLIAEDEESIRLLLCSDLQSRGMAVTVIADGAELEALPPALVAGFDCLVTDVVMPTLGGPALAERLRRVRPGLPVLFMTGFADALRLGDILAQPATALIDKPFRLEEVAAALAGLMQVAAAINRGE